MTRVATQPLPRQAAVVRGIILLAGSVVLGAVCCWIAGISDVHSDPVGRLFGGALLGLIASPAFLYAMWHGPRLHKGLSIVALNLVSAAIIGQALGMGGALFVSGPAFIMICASFGGDGPKAALERARELNICVACGYSLAGNESGVCPECGVKTSGPA